MTHRRRKKKARKAMGEAWRSIRHPMPPPTRVEVDERQKALERLARHEMRHFSDE